MFIGGMARDAFGREVGGNQNEQSSGQNAINDAVERGNQRSRRGGGGSSRRGSSSQGSSAPQRFESQLLGASFESESALQQAENAELARRQSVQDESNRRARLLPASGVTGQSSATPIGLQEAGIASSGNKSFRERIAQGARNAYNKLTGAEARQQRQEEEAMKLQSGFRERGFTPSGQGTTIQYNKPYTDKEIEDLFSQNKVSQFAGSTELARRASVDYSLKGQAFIKEKTQDSQNKAQKELDTFTADLQEQVREGKITSNQANYYLKSKSDELNQKLNTQLENASNEFAEGKGKELQDKYTKNIDNLNDKRTINSALEKAPLILLGGAGTGLAIGGAVALAPLIAPVIDIGGIALAGYAVAETGGYLKTSYQAGTLTSSKVAATLIPQALFLAGGFAGARLLNRAKPNPIEQARLEKILENPENYKVVSNRAITNEIEIQGARGAKLSSELGEIKASEVHKQIRLGNRIELKELKIDPKNPQDAKLVEKYLPKQKIKFISATNQQGNVQAQISVGESNLGRGFRTGTAKSISGGLGETNPLGITETDIISVTTSKGKISEIAKTKQFVKSKVEYTLDKRGRLVQSTSAQFEVASKKSGSKPLQFSDLANIRDTEFTPKNRFPRTDTISQELQSLTGEAKAFEAQKGTSKGQFITETNLDIAFRKAKRFQTESSLEKVAQVIKPIEFDKVFTKPSKNVKQDIEFPDIGNPQPKLKRGRGRPRKIELKSLDIEDLPTTVGGGGKAKSQFESQVLEQLEFDDVIPSQSLNDRVARTTRQALDNLNKNSPDLNPLFNQKLVTHNKDITINLPNNVTVNVNKIKEESDNLFPTFNFLTNTAPKVKSAYRLGGALNQPSLSNSLQLEIQSIQNQLETRSFTRPPLNPPTRPIPEFPFFLPSKDLPSGKRKAFKAIKIKASKRIPKYTASLAAAAAQANPLKVTKKQLAKLNTTVFTGAEARPVIELVSDNNDISKALNKVQF